MVGLVLILVFLTPIAGGYLFFRDKLAIPDPPPHAPADAAADAPTR